MTEIYRDIPEELKLVPPSSEVLNQVADAISPSEVESNEIQAIIEGMLDMARGEQGNPKRPTMVGLSAPQVGIPKRIIVVGVNASGKGEEPEFSAYINPTITGRTMATNPDREGCYSTGRVCGIVARANGITIEALDRRGKPIKEEHHGFPARIFQHEIDHLDGIRFPDRIPQTRSLHWVPVDRFGEYRDRWQDWPIECSREIWQAIKMGREYTEPV